MKRWGARQAPRTNVFCIRHPGSFLEARFVDDGVVVWECPECEREDYYKTRYGSITQDS